MFWKTDTPGSESRVYLVRSGVLALLDLGNGWIDQAFDLNDRWEAVLSPQILCCGLHEFTHRQWHNLVVEGVLDGMKAFPDEGEFFRSLIELELQCHLVSTQLSCFKRHGGRLRADLVEMMDKFSIAGTQQLDHSQVPASCILHQLRSTAGVVTQLGL